MALHRVLRKPWRFQNRIRSLITTGTRGLACQVLVLLKLWSKSRTLTLICSELRTNYISQSCHSNSPLLSLQQYMYFNFSCSLMKNYFIMSDHVRPWPTKTWVGLTLCQTRFCKLQVSLRSLSHVHTFEWNCSRTVLRCWHRCDV